MSDESSAHFESLEVTNTRHLEGGRDVTVEVCGEGRVASVYAFSEATVDVAGSVAEPFALLDSDVVGVIISGDPFPDIHLSDGTIGNNPVGVAFVDGAGETSESFDEFDIATRLEDNVSYIDNVINIDAQFLPIPKPSFEFYCDNGIDDDGDGCIDCEDSDCFCN